jgi:hypothetical protein
MKGKWPAGQTGRQAGIQAGRQVGRRAGRKESGHWAGRRTGRRLDRQASGWVACHQTPLLLFTMAGTGGRLTATTLTPSLKPPLFLKRLQKALISPPPSRRSTCRILGLVVRRFINAVAVFSVFFKLCFSLHIPLYDWSLTVVIPPYFSLPCSVAGVLDKPYSELTPIS